MLVEVGVDSHRHVVANAHHSSECIGTQTHVSVLTHHLETLALLLHRIVVAAQTINLQLGSLDFAALTGTLTLNQCTLGANAGTSGDILQYLLVELSGINNNLHILDGRTVVEGNEVNCFRAAVRAHPTLYANFLAIFCAFQHINNLCTFHIIYFYS